jgi:hypothetical protein
MSKYCSACPILAHTGMVRCYYCPGVNNAYTLYTVPTAAHISEKYLGVYMGASPLAGKFPKAV